MGRRSVHTPEELRELIIQAATEIVEQHGLEGLSAREVAKRIGYSPGTIYNVFENLDDLLLTIEARLLASAARVYCGNRELAYTLAPARPDIVELFCPGTLLNPQRFQRTELSVFTFGMAHKIRVPLYRRLRDLLEATGRSYSVYVSTALHENTSFDGSFVVRFEELQSIFNGQVYFMGYLSDTAVFNYLVECTFLAAFFEKGLRANNTSVNAAMECGCAVITNLDEHSPRNLVHMRNVIDINVCDRLPDFEQVERIGRAARDLAHADFGWEQLVVQLQRPVVEL